jgi:hypothetical protein
VLRGHASETPAGPKDLPEHVRERRGAVIKRDPLAGSCDPAGKASLQFAPSWSTAPSSLRLTDRGIERLPTGQKVSDHRESALDRPRLAAVSGPFVRFYRPGADRLGGTLLPLARWGAFAHSYDLAVFPAKKWYARVDSNH